MRLRTQSILLLSLILFVEIVFVGGLLFELAKFEGAAARETHAKLVIAQCDEIRAIALNANLELLSFRFLGRKDFEASIERGKESILKNVRRLQELTKSEPSALAAVKRYEVDLSRMFALFEDAFRAYRADAESPDFAHFIDSKEFLEELSEVMGNALKDGQQLTAQYTPLVQELQPQAVAHREALRTTVLSGLLLNLLVVAFVAILVGRNTMRRLDQLMGNIAGFRDDRQDLNAISGNDELAELDREFRQAVEARREAERKRQAIVWMVSHDLRSPLTSIAGTLTLLADGIFGDITEKTLDRVGRVNVEMERLIRMINDLLDNEKIQAGQFNLEKGNWLANHLVEQSLVALQGLAETKGVVLESDVEPRLMVICDSDRIIQVMVNLLANAIKYSQSGETVLIRARSQPGKRARLEVVDHGPGLSQNAQAKVFDAFQQAEGSERYGSSGLGLSICKSLVEKHGGTVGVISEPGKGSTFWFEIEGEVAD